MNFIDSPVDKEVPVYASDSITGQFKRVPWEIGTFARQGEENPRSPLRVPYHLKEHSIDLRPPLHTPIRQGDFLAIVTHTLGFIVWVVFINRLPDFVKPSSVGDFSSLGDSEWNGRSILRLVSIIVTSSRASAELYCPPQNNRLSQCSAVDREAVDRKKLVGG